MQSFWRVFRYAACALVLVAGCAEATVVTEAPPDLTGVAFEVHQEPG